MLCMNTLDISFEMEFVKNNLMQKSISFKMLFACFWKGLAKLFGVEKASQMLLKIMCKTRSKFSTFLFEFGRHFGSIFGLRMVDLAENFRFRSDFSWRLCFAGVQVPVQA